MLTYADKALRYGVLPMLQVTIKDNAQFNPSINGSFGKILIADVHRTQQTDKVKCILKKADLINVPPGCRS